MLAQWRDVYAMDRRGRGASGDGPAYAIEREFEDVAAVAAAITTATARDAIDVVGHSYGGRCALGASLLTRAIRHVVAYEGAPVPRGVEWANAPSIDAVRDAVRRGDHESALEAFFRTVVGMDDAAIARYRADAVWPLRVGAVPTLIRELDGETSAGAGLEALAGARVPVLQLVGTASPPTFRAGTIALQERLRDGRVVAIEGAAHAAHHTHPEAFVEAVEAFLDG